MFCPFKESGCHCAARKIMAKAESRASERFFPFVRVVCFFDKDANFYFLRVPNTPLVRGFACLGSLLAARSQDLRELACLSLFRGSSCS